MKVHGEHFVRLDDGTCWAVDRGDPDLEWILRYGLPDEVYRVRLVVASVLASYKALLDKPQQRRNEIVTALRSALATGWPAENRSEDT